MTEKKLHVDHPEHYLPHRQPFLFVDHAQVSTDMSKVWASYTFMPDAPYFAGHFPDNPIVPGVVLLECLAQSAHLLLSLRAKRTLSGYLVGVESAKFNQTVRPHQTVRFEAQLLRETGELSTGDHGARICSFKASAYLNDVRCVRANINLYQASPAQPIDSQLFNTAEVN